MPVILKKIWRPGAAGSDSLVPRSFAAAMQVIGISREDSRLWVRRFGCKKLGFIVILWDMNVIYSGILMGYTLW